MRNRILNKIKTFSVIAIALMSTNSIAQYQQGVGLHFGGVDYFGPQGGKYFFNSVTSLKYNIDSARYDTTKSSKLVYSPAVRLSYLKQLSKNFDLFIGGTVSGAVAYPTMKNDTNYYDFMMRDPNAAAPYTRKYYTAIDGRLQYNIVDRSHFFSPYLAAGVSLLYFNRENFGYSIPVALGANFNLSKAHDLFLNIESSYKIPLNTGNYAHLVHLIGFNYFWGGKKTVVEPAVVVPPVVAAPVDTDGDGIPDASDKCPTVSGLAQFAGCPDTDGDGIQDSEDKCPSQAGIAKYAGCPIPDTDGDGINDEEDKCVTVAGLARYGGCPIPDTDGDGFNDEVDKCPAVASTTNNGCPEIKKEVIEKINKAAGSVYFDSGKSILKPAAKKQLDIIIGELQKESNLYADINGYTDASGDVAKNTQLSKDRAKACYDYLILKGINQARLTHEGYGPENPVADNATAAGRAKNRRTEFKLRSF